VSDWTASLPVRFEPPSRCRTRRPPTPFRTGQDVVTPDTGLAVQSERPRTLSHRTPFWRCAAQHVREPWVEVPPAHREKSGRKVEARVSVVIRNRVEAEDNLRSVTKGSSRDPRVNRSARREPGETRTARGKPIRKLSTSDVSADGTEGSFTNLPAETSYRPRRATDDRHGNGLSSRVRRKDQRGGRTGLDTPGVKPEIRRKPKLVVNAVRGVRRTRSSAEPRVTPRDSRLVVREVTFGAKARELTRRGPARCGQPSKWKAGISHERDRRFLRERPDGSW
jgi:hypothetical protein